ncbi:MAG: transposase, partial [Candidatus Poribacteria bacterium]
MRTLNHKQYFTELRDNLTRWLKRKSRRISKDLVEAALILMGLDLQPARNILAPLYSKNPRGRKPYDPIIMLRALLLMVLLQYKSIPKFAKDLKAKPRIAKIAGFFDGDVPVAGTFYLFIDRLEDGKYQKPCQHLVKQSKLRKGKHLRNLTTEKEQRQKDKQMDLTLYDSVTQKLKDELLAKKDQPRPNDLQKRLEDILMRCAIIPSVEKGFIKDTQAMTVCGDGSALQTAASRHGKPSCNCREKGIKNCDHPRFYSDPTANWGYDSYRDCYYFGHTFYQHVISTNGHDLPLHVTISDAAETDFTLSMKSLSRLRKALAENGLSWHIENAVYDAGHDALGIYEYLMEHKIKPVIALNQRAGTYPKPTGTAEKVNEDGIPLCKAPKPMRRHGYERQKKRIYYNCPVKRPTHRNGKRCWVAYPDECPRGVLCQPDTKMGPVVYVRTEDDPRLYPAIRRDTDKFKRLFKKRSSCERSNSQKKETYRL